jgi:hypothetical protein
MKTLCICLFGAITIFALAQDAKQRDCGTSETSFACAHTIDCSKFNSLGCASFNEMVSKNDKQITSAIQLGTTLVCFRRFEDVFFAFSYTKPLDRLFRLSSQTGVSTQSGLAKYVRIKNGITEDERFISGTWSNMQFGNNTVMSFDTKPGSSIPTNISDTEIMFTYSLQT